MDNPDPIKAKKDLQALIDKYTNLTPEEIKRYTEEETKKDFVLPLFEILGWDVTNKNKKEVSAEESQSGGRVDYGFYFDSRIRFYTEAKKLSAKCN